MTNSPIQVTTDLGQILEKIDKKIDKFQEQIEQKIDALQRDVSSLKIEQAEIRGDIKALDAKVDGISKRLDNQEFINRSVVIGLLLAILAGFAKMFFPQLGMK